MYLMNCYIADFKGACLAQRLAAITKYSGNLNLEDKG